MVPAGSSKLEYWFSSDYGMMHSVSVFSKDGTLLKSVSVNQTETEGEGDMQLPENAAVVRIHTALDCAMIKPSIVREVYETDGTSYGYIHCDAPALLRSLEVLEDWW